MPHRYLRAVEALVAHGVREMSVEGASLEHTLREVALMAALVGAGANPTTAIRQVEAIEPELLRMHPGEAIEGFHTGAIPGAFGKGATPYGKGAGIPGATGVPGTMPGAYGKGAMPYGKTIGAPGAYGKGTMPYGKTLGQGVGVGAYGKGTTPATATPYMGYR